ncbi:MAG: hypothetical protein J0M15_16315 [Deltaproteobacteria bacterium]|jgi:hypothetical protein|nr:hypothetical protein [Deltaproteobacteria bacterium]
MAREGFVKYSSFLFSFLILLLSGCMAGSIKMESLKNDSPSASPGTGTQSQIKISRQDGQALSAGGVALPVGTALNLKALLFNASGELKSLPVRFFEKVVKSIGHKPTV